MTSGEPIEKKSLLKLLETWEPSEEILPDVDQGLMPLDNVELPATELSEQAILSKAVVRTAGFLELPDNILASILDISPATVKRLKCGDYMLSKGRPEWELGVLVVRIHDALDAIAGPMTNAWITNKNSDFYGKRPIYAMQSPEGLRAVCDYLEAHLNQA